MLLLEHWKPIVGYEGLYEISNCGNVFSLISMRPLAAQFNHGDYRYASLTKNKVRKRKRINRIVAEAFLGPIPCSLEVDHKDNWRANDRVSNLNFLTHLDNMRRRKQTPVIPSPDSEGAAKAREIRQLAGTASYRKIAAITGVDVSTAYRIINRKRWKHIA